MTVLLVLATFAIFLTIDFFYSKAKHPALQLAPATGKQESALPQLPNLVGGFSVPDNRRYHPGHTWALSESPNLVRVGMDDFAAKLTGKIEHVNATAARTMDPAGTEGLEHRAQRREGRHGLPHRRQRSRH